MKTTSVSREYFDSDYKHHNVNDNPAFISTKGDSRHWYRHGILHREIGPAKVSSVRVIWYLHNREIGFSSISGITKFSKNIDKKYDVGDYVTTAKEAVESDPRWKKLFSKDFPSWLEKP